MAENSLEPMDMNIVGTTGRETREEDERFAAEIYKLSMALTSKDKH